MELTQDHLDIAKMLGACETVDRLQVGQDVSEVGQENLIWFDERIETGLGPLWMLPCYGDGGHGGDGYGDGGDGYGDGGDGCGCGGGGYGDGHGHGDSDYGHGGHGGGGHGGHGGYGCGCGGCYGGGSGNGDGYGGCCA